MSRPPTRNPLITPRISHERFVVSSRTFVAKSCFEGWDGLALHLDWFRAKHQPWVLAILLVDNTARHTKISQNKSRLDNVSLSQTKKTHASPSQTTSGNGRSGVGWRAHTAER